MKRTISTKRNRAIRSNLLWFLFLMPITAGNCDLAGNWVETGSNQEGYTNYLSFQDNGRFEQVIDLDASWDQDTLHFSGDYTVSNDTLIMNYSGPKDQVRYKIIQCKKKRMVMEFISDSGGQSLRKTLKRVDHMSQYPCGSRSPDF